LGPKELGVRQSGIVSAIMSKRMATDTSQEDLASKVIQIIAEKQRIPVDTISIDSTFEELKIDSLDGINIVFAIEEAFDISVPDEGVQTLKTVREMIDGVRKLVEAKDSGLAPGIA
jgi:acyl carrier protein